MKNIQAKLNKIANLFVNQENSRVIVEPMRASKGYWFGGGNMIEIDDTLYLVGRYRNYGDSRTGVELGERGCELAIFKSTDGGESFHKVKSFSKEDLSVNNQEIVSIEGAALCKDSNGVRLFISTEKRNFEYNKFLDLYIKPGTGVWSIDEIKGPNIDALDVATMKSVIRGVDPRYFHIKDPFVYQPNNGPLVLGYCSHPFSWASSNSGYIKQLNNHMWSNPKDEFFPRGTVWDVAITRTTSLVEIEGTDYGLAFYDGGESLRQLEEHPEAKKRPRGYSCEEIGGVGYFKNNDIDNIKRLSINYASFVSPYGTGSSRYVSVCKTAKGYYITWEQSQKDLSQPLVMNFVSHKEVKSIIEND